MTGRDYLRTSVLSIDVARTHHHIVSRGYQRFFADGKRILLIDKHQRTARLAGTRDTFASERFSSFRVRGRWMDDELEDQWMQRENYALPHVRRLLDGQRGDEERGAVKILGAVHFARSYMLEDVLRRITPEVIEEQRADMLTDEEFHRRYEQERGRLPTEDDIDDLLGEMTAAMFDDRTLIADRMAHAFGRSLEIIGDSHVQLVWPKTKRTEFVFADTPIVHYRGADVGGRKIALGDADRVFIPLGPRLLALFSRRPMADGPIEDTMVQHLNHLSWMAASRYLGAHPDAHLFRATLQPIRVDRKGHR